MTTEQQRRVVDLLGAAVGRDEANELATILVPFAWEELAQRADLRALEAEVRGDLAAIRGEMVGLKGGLRGEMAELRGEMATLASGLRGDMSELRGDMSELRGEVATLASELRGELSDVREELRGEMAQLRGEMATKAELSSLDERVRDMLPRMIRSNIAAMVGVAGLVLAAGAI